MILQKMIQRLLLFILIVTCVPINAIAEQYNVVYLICGDLEQALDYKEELEAVLGGEESRNVHVTSKGKNEYAVVFNGNDSTIPATKIIITHGAILEKAGMSVPFMSKDSDYKTLYNVSYGMGPNIDALKKIYTKVYATLGEDVGKNLLIEKTDWNNYKLIYRRRGDKKSTSAVARRHGRVLRSKKVKTAIAIENNNEIVFGESSLLDEKEIVVEKHPKTQKDDVKEVVRLRPSDKVVYKNEHPDKVIVPPVVKVVVKPIEIEKVYVSADPKKYKKKFKTAKKRTLNLAADTQVEKRIKKYIAGLRQKGKLSRDESTAWMVYDLTSGKPLVDINPNLRFQTASMIKPFVALAFFHKVKEGKLKYGPKSKRKLVAMIQRSSNTATNWVMRQVGGPRSCQRIIEKYYPDIFKGTSIVEYIPAGGKTYKNKAYPSDYVRFLKRLWEKKLPYSTEMRRLMALPGRDRLYSNTPIPKGTLVYNKTGSTGLLCGDMGILVPKTKSGLSHPYVIVGIIQKKSKARNYGSWIASRSKVIREVSTIVYKELKKTSRLR